MARRPSPHTITAMIQAVRDAGLEICRVDVSADGAVSLVTSTAKPATVDTPADMGDAHEALQKLRSRLGKDKDPVLRGA